MVESEICKDCQWNEYPLCGGVLMNGIKLSIENHHKEFQCGQKENKEVAVIDTETNTQDAKIKELEETIAIILEKLA